MELRSDLNNERLTETIRGLIEENYDLGKVRGVKNIFGGYCNKSYAVWMSANNRTHRYFLRLYQPKAIESEILFEHALLNHLRSNGFTLAAAIIPCRNGATMVHTPAPENHRGDTALWALFEFLDGEDKYSWTDTDLTDKEFMSAADALAQLRPPGLTRANDRDAQFLQTLGQKADLRALSRAIDARNGDYHDCLLLALIACS